MLAARPRSWFKLTAVSAVVSIFCLFQLYSSGRLRRVSAPRLPEHEVASLHNVPYTAAIIYLAQTEFGRHNDLIKSLIDIHNNLPSHPWPIILFHTGAYDDHLLRTNLTASIHERLGQTNSAQQLVHRIEFQRLNWTLPPGISSDVNVVDPVHPHRWPGYHHMCAFFTSQIFTHPRLRDLTFYMRMDTDSFIDEPVCYDPIEVMHRRNMTYGWRYLGQDPGWAVKGLWALLSDYSRSHPQVENMLAHNKWDWPVERIPEKMVENSFTGYYNNFEIVRLESFRRPDVQDWLQEIPKDPERHFKYRWGDGPIRFATVNMFFDLKTEVQEFCAIPFYHQWKIDGCPCEKL